jgi:hypothetical protein
MLNRLAIHGTASLSLSRIICTLAGSLVCRAGTPVQQDAVGAAAVPPGVAAVEAALPGAEVAAVVPLDVAAVEAVPRDAAVAVVAPLGAAVAAEAPLGAEAVLRAPDAAVVAALQPDARVAAPDAMAGCPPDATAPCAPDVAVAVAFQPDAEVAVLGGAAEALHVEAENLPADAVAPCAPDVTAFPQARSAASLRGFAVSPAFQRPASVRRGAAAVRRRQDAATARRVSLRQVSLHRV